MNSTPSNAGPENRASGRHEYDLRPLSTGEVLDRTFHIYRSRFALFASLAALPAAVQFAGSALQVLLARTEEVTRNGRMLTVAAHPLAIGMISLVTALVMFTLYGITQAASTWAVAEIYLGKTASLRAAWQTATADGFRYVRVVLRQYWSVIWPLLLGFALFGIVMAVPGRSAKIALGLVGGALALASVIYSIRAALRVSLAVSAAVIESLGASGAVRRSMDLLKERKFRILLLGVLVLGMALVVGVALSPLQVLAVRSHGVEQHVLQMLYLAGTFLVSLLVGPVGAIGLCLFYFDERVRHEGFDIEFLMQRASDAPVAEAEQLAESSQSPELI